MLNINLRTVFNLSLKFLLFNVFIGVELCIRYNLDEAALVETWMAYSVTNAEDMKPTINSFLLMEKKMLCKSSRTPVSSKKQVPVPVSHYKDTGTYPF